MALLDDQTYVFVSTSVEQTERLGLRLGMLLEAQDLVCLSGDLGAGKTAMARGIGRGWGTAVPITSPTFTLVNEYPRTSDGRILYHVDAYRLESEASAITTGIEDLLDMDAPMMIEWPSQIDMLLPKERLSVTLTHYSETRRSIEYRAIGDRATALLKEFRASAFGG